MFFLRGEWIFCTAYKSLHIYRYVIIILKITYSRNNLFLPMTICYLPNWKMCYLYRMEIATVHSINTSWRHLKSLNDISTIPSRMNSNNIHTKNGNDVVNIFALLWILTLTAVLCLTTVTLTWLTFHLLLFLWWRFFRN